MPSIFTRIVQGTIPCHKVAEDDRYLAFLDIEPLREGHTLVIPKMEVDKFFELPADVLSGMMPFAQEVAKKMARAIPCDRIGVSVIGLEVPHAHMHLIPIDRMSDMDFSGPRRKFTSGQLAEIAERIKNA